MANSQPSTQPNPTATSTQPFQIESMNNKLPVHERPRRELLHRSAMETTDLYQTT
jgi:hypothetical protein